MNILKVFFLVFLFVSSLFAKEELKFGLLHGEVFLNEKEAKVATNLWLRHMKEQRFDVNFSVVLYNDKKKILEDYKNKKISALISTGYFYYENKEFLENESIRRWVLSSSNRMNIQYYLIKNRKSYFSLSNLDTKKVLYQNRLERVWAESLFLKNGANSKKVSKVFSRIKKSKSSIFNLFFNENNIAVIKKDLYDSMLDLNPQLKDKIEIVKKSEPIFFKAIGFTKSGIKKSHQDILIEMTNRINEEEVDFGVLSFLQIQKVFNIESNELEKLDKFYSEYIRLKKSNN